MKVLVLCVIAALSAAAQTVPGRYILELESAPPAGKTERSARIRAEQELVKGALALREVTVRATVDTVANAIIVEGADPAQLAGLPGVRRIHEVRYLTVKLDRVLPLMKLPEAWEKAGGRDRAGAGIKIGIIDTGIDYWHLGFQDSSMKAPDGFPKFSPETNRSYTNGKVIVARSYDGGSAEDKVGHGTGVAMAAAGVYHLGARGFMAGAAPGAWLGSYRANDGPSERFTTDNILRAMDDAVKDGMDVINLSLGAPGISSTADSILSLAIQKAVQSGVVMVTAAGNEGPDVATISDAGSTDEAISVGASENDRIPTSPALIIEGASITPFIAAPASNSEGHAPIQGTLLDITQFDRSGLGCGTFPPNSLRGKVALIQRGECFFSEKFANAQAAGAVAAVVYNNSNNPTRVIMDVGSETLAGLMISRADGNTVKDRLAAQPDTTFVLFFSLSLPEDPNQVADFSSRGPTVDLTVKPDVLAIGGNVITATNGTTPGDPDTSGYIVADGTSLSSPLVAGAAAVVKGARPGLTVAQYRSLVINSARTFPEGSNAIDVQQTGAGILNLSAALTTNAVATPVSVSFGELRGQSSLSKDLTVGNVGRGDTFTMEVVSNDSLKPELSSPSVSLGQGATATVKVSWPHASPPAGAYQGYIQIKSADGSVSQVPYWLAVRSTTPKAISLASLPVRGTPGSQVDVLFRVVDGASLSLLEPQPDVTVVGGGGTVTLVRLLGSQYPGLYVGRLRLGLEAGINTFKVTAGGLERQFNIRGGN
ncbi:MAG: S8 family serine peptidase [Acidobacteria bacterium]|nr:S8 family serine peptidase [Acidobacteriota bacterium]